MNRRIIVLLILIGLFAVIGVTIYAYAEGLFETSEQTSEVSSESLSETTSSKQSEVSSEVASEKSEAEVKSEPVESEVASESSELASEAESDSQVTTDSEAQYDENGDLREDSKYLDEDGDTIANYFDICPGVDDFSADCETDAYDTADDANNDDSVADENSLSDTSDEVSESVDENGDAREESTYLDDDGDTVANLYDVCPGVDDFSDECDTSVYDK